MPENAITKWAAEEFFIKMIYRPPDLEDDETISTATATASTGLTIGSPAVDGNEVSVKIGGGTAGAIYTVTFTMESSSGNKFIDIVTIRVR